MIVTQNTKLNVIPGGIIPVVHVSQYDTGREISFTLYDGNAPAVLDSETVVFIEGTKTDGHGFSYEGTIVDNVVTFETTEQMTVFTGGIECKLKLVLGSQVIGTAMFILDVEKAGINDETIISDTEIPMIIALAREEMERAEAAAISANNSMIAAGSSMRIAGESEATAVNAAAICSSILPVVRGYKDNAENSATSAEANALKSEGFAVGKQNGTNVTSESPYYHNNSKYWADYARQYAEGGIHYKNAIFFANIPTTGMVVGDMYDIKDNFTTDSRFSDGEGVPCEAGTNIIWNANGKWDIDVQGSGAGVTGVKGNAEETYRRGNVNLTPSDLGAVNEEDYEEDIESIHNQLTDQTNILGAKNLIPYPYYNTTKIENGLTFTDNGDGTVTVNGTATAQTDFALANRTKDCNVYLKAGERYTLSGCPSGGSSSTYEIWINKTKNGAALALANDYGNGATFTLDEVSETYYGIVIRIRNGQTLNNLVFKPMLRLASDPDDTYVPYAMTNRELTERVGFETAGIAKIIGDTSVTFTNSAIKTTSELHLLSENASNTPVFYTAVTVIDGSATYTFPALTEATTFYLVIK